MKLNEEQKQLVEDNINLIYYTIKLVNGNVHDIDLIEIGYIELCNAALSYNNQKGTFANFAVANIKNKFIMEFKSNCTDKRKANHNYLSLNVPYNENNDGDYIDILPDKRNNIEEFIDVCSLNHVYNRLLKRYKNDKRALDIFNLLSQEYNQTEIAKILGVNVSAINEKIRKIRTQTKQILKELEEL